jgi:ATP-dependent RNA helicase RhlE
VVQATSRRLFRQLSRWFPSGVKIIFMMFKELGLMTELQRAVAEQGYSKPTPIQAKAIPAVLAGDDVLAGAQTGTGKTAAFTLPLLQLLSQTPVPQKKRPVRALVLTPTRELAAQIDDNVRAYSKYLKLRSSVIFGGVSIRPQIAALNRGIDILVATPGRLLDHIGQKTLDLSQVEILVLDEADRMLDMGFIHDIRKILALLPKKRQNLLFSATFSGTIRQLADGFLNNPTQIEVAKRNTTTELVQQSIYQVDKSRKRALLTSLIRSEGWQQLIVFTRTKHGANRLSEQLGKDGIVAAAIHGNKSQNARTKALNDFKKGGVKVLVATDIAARGLDIDQLPCVVNYELPNVSEDYVHRIGRTGRAGSSGTAVSLVCQDEANLLRDIEKLLATKLEKRIVEGFEPGTEHKTRSQENPRRSDPSKSKTGRRPQRRNFRRKTSAAKGRSDNQDRSQTAK